MEIIINAGQSLSLDTQKWNFARHTTCLIKEHKDDGYLIENGNGLEGFISYRQLADNHLSPEDGYVVLSEGLYKKIFETLTKANQSNFLNQTFDKQAKRVFKAKEVLFSKAEFFLLRPSKLYNICPYIKPFHLCLGALVLAWEEQPNLYFPFIHGKANCYLMSVSGSVLSGRHSYFLWSASDERIYGFNSLKHPLPGNIKRYLDILRPYDRPEWKHVIDFQGDAIQDLVYLN